MGDLDTFWFLEDSYLGHPFQFSVVHLMYFLDIGQNQFNPFKKKGVKWFLGFSSNPLALKLNLISAWNL